MLSIEIAKKLKDAGLVWEPAFGDLFYCQDDDRWEKSVLAEQDTQEATHQIHECIADWVFAPRLEQLLAAIEKRGYKVESMQDACYIFHPQKSSRWQEFLAENRIEAAAQALLWVLERRTAE
ncbi:MAG TPA: hypothetical protein DCZ10_18425 [Pelotomaculum sp.]|jgi:hypothetical protein|nr:hypothetical protein [Pelotomaculum sp.]